VELSLAGNRISSVPRCAVNLKSLRILTLSRNKFVSIDTSIWPNLVSFSFYGNSLSSAAELQLMTQLRERGSVVSTFMFELKFF
jgi:Leucine-rich repeat (LRR) protein